MRFDFLSLKLFIAVCEEQGIARAAEREHIAASAISKRISDLEEMLETSLFHRSARGLELTAPGRALLHHARVVMRDLQQMESELAHHASGVCGQIRICASVAAIIQNLPRDLRDFLVHHPAVSIDLEEGTSQEAVQAVAENAADIGIFGGAVPVSGLQVIPYCTDTIVAIVPRGHVLSRKSSVRFAELADYDLVGPQKGSFLESLVIRAAADLKRPLSIPIRVSGFETVCSMVEAELGVGLVPQECGSRYASDGGLVALRLDEGWATRQWYICAQKEPALPSTVRLLLKHLSQKRSRMASLNALAPKDPSLLPVDA